MSVTLIIIVFTVAVSFAAFGNKPLFDRLKLHPAVMNTGGEAYRMFSYALIHADWLHLAVNMYVLYNFGDHATEAVYALAFGSKGVLFYILLYVGGAVLSVFPAFEKNKNNFGYTAVGASGAVSAVVFAYILFNPLATFYFLFIPFPIPAYVFGLFYLVISYVLARQNRGNIGHDAHFFGALFGMMFTILLDKDIALRFIEMIKLQWN
jgi:membrane associated rhomboid family serine protease